MRIPTGSRNFLKSALVLIVFSSLFSFFAAAQDNTSDFLSNSVLDILPKPTKNSIVTLVSIEKFPFKEHYYLAQYYTSIKDNSNRALIGKEEQSTLIPDLSLAFIEFQGKKTGVKLVASSIPIRQEVDKLEMIDQGFQFYGFKLDPTNYNICNFGISFGLSSNWSIYYPGGCHTDDEYLDLFVVLGSEILHVFSICAYHEQVGASRIDGEMEVWESLSEQNHLDLLPHKTDGFSDLKVTHYVNNNLDEIQEEKPDSIEVYQWNKTLKRYTLQKRI
ncbi:MAG TPA: hypothetical protein VHY08_07425 [Bacillota bacterium]|nr:hypothetical protein [Bacillota bacterium]